MTATVSLATDARRDEAGAGHAAAHAGVGTVLAYGALGLPLAFAALPIYVHAPPLYAVEQGLSLAVVGWVLLATRLVDALSDPLLGWAADRFASRRIWIGAGLPVLAVGLYGLLLPPADAGAAWLAAMLVLVSLGHSASSIAYHAWAAEASVAGGLRLRLVASREAFALLGVLLAAALPAASGAGAATLAWGFAPLAAVAAVLTLGFPPPTARLPAGVPATPLTAFAHPGLRRLLTVFAVNGIAAAIPVSTVMFFIADVLHAEAWSGLFLALYFLAAALGLPLWVRVARRVGELRAWLLGMSLAVVAFSSTWTLGPGEVVLYAMVCVLSGFALGADLSMPPVMLADLLSRSGAASHRPSPGGAGAWFGWWNFVAKANLAVAAGLVLPLLAWFGYEPGVRTDAGASALAGVYGLMPVMLKIAAAVVLWRAREHLQTRTEEGNE